MAAQAPPEKAEGHSTSSRSSRPSPPNSHVSWLPERTCRDSEMPCRQCKHLHYWLFGNCVDKQTSHLSGPRHAYCPSNTDP